MSNTDNLTKRLRRAVDRALTFSDDVIDDRAVPFDDLVMRDRALAAFDAELRLPQPPSKVAKETHYLDPAKFSEGHENVNPEDHLSACPFCNRTELARCWDDGLYWIRCASCGATGPETTKYSGEEGDPYFDWNSRPTAITHPTTLVAKLIAEEIDALLASRLRPDVYVTFAPANQEIAAIITRHLPATSIVPENVAQQIVGTVFDNTAASHETLKRTMIERITDYFAAVTTSPERSREIFDAGFTSADNEGENSNDRVDK